MTCCNRWEKLGMSALPLNFGGEESPSQIEGAGCLKPLVSLCLLMRPPKFRAGMLTARADQARNYVLNAFPSFGFGLFCWLSRPFQQLG